MVDEYARRAFGNDVYPTAVAARHTVWMKMAGVEVPGPSAYPVHVLCAAGYRGKALPGEGIPAARCAVLFNRGVR